MYEVYVPFQDVKGMRDDWKTFDLFCFRHADIGDASAGHPANAGERAPVVLLRLFHLRHRWRAAMAGYTETAVLHPQGNEHNVAQVSARPPSSNIH